MNMNIPFNKPTLVGNEIEYIIETVNKGHISGDGSFTKKCHKFLEQKFDVNKVLLTTSCTHALELASILVDIQPGDEIILSSFTFVSTANSFILRGGKPIFVDIRKDTLNIDENLIEQKITPRTKAIYPVHYAGVACDMDRIKEIAKKYGLFIVEDAAQGVNAKYKNDYLGTIGDIGTYSFHETKNYYCGEGGAILLNNSSFIERAEIIREKGTDRSKFFRGEVDKYTWVDIGSSYLPSDLLAAFLYAQFEQIEEVYLKRKAIYEYYYSGLKVYQEAGLLQLPVIPGDCHSNYHMFHLILPHEIIRNYVMDYLKSHDILAVFHYIPLHSSPMGQKYGYKSGDFPITEDLSSRLLRLPMYSNISMEELEYIIATVGKALNSFTKRNNATLASN